MDGIYIFFYGYYDYYYIYNCCYIIIIYYMAAVRLDKNLSLFFFWILYHDLLKFQVQQNYESHNKMPKTKQ